MHEYYEIDVGDIPTFYDSSMFPHDAEVSGIFDFYVGRTAFLSPASYREIFGEDAVNNVYFVKLPEGTDAAALNAAVRDVDGFLMLSDAAAARSQIEATSDALNVLIIVMIIIAGLMAFFILLNLSSSYMLHKQRELTVMRINGFTYKETKDYASTELIITSLAGILLGLPLGALLGYWTQRLSEQSDLQMVRTVDWRSMVFSALITGVFAAFINGMSLRKIKDLSLSDI
jgi:ABC-type antimicrobial peptide transport system permease subunit